MSNENSTDFKVTAAFEALRYLVFRGMKGEPGTNGTDGKSLRVNEAGHIIYWNDESKEWVDTGIEAEGAPGPEGDPGFSPTVAVDVISGGHRVTITDEDGPHRFDVLDGNDGKDGMGGAMLLHYSQDTNAVTDYVTGNAVTQQEIKDAIDGGIFAFLYVDGPKSISRWIPYKSYSSSGAAFDMEGIQVVVTTRQGVTNGVLTITEKFLPLVTKSDAGNVLTVSSSGRWGALPPAKQIRFLRHYVYGDGPVPENTITDENGRLLTGEQIFGIMQSGVYPLIVDYGFAYPRVYKPEIILEGIHIQYRAEALNGDVFGLYIEWNSGIAETHYAVGTLPLVSSEDAGRVLGVNKSGLWTAVPSSSSFRIHMSGNADDGYTIEETPAEVIAHYPDLTLVLDGSDYEYRLVGARNQETWFYLEFAHDDNWYTDGTVERHFIDIQVGVGQEGELGSFVISPPRTTFLRNLPQASAAYNGKALGVVNGNYAFIEAQPNALYYVDDGTLKSAATNLSCTQEQVRSDTVAKGIVPVIQYSRSANEMHYFYLSEDGSVGLYFLTLDGVWSLNFVDRNSAQVAIEKLGGAG